MDVFRDWAYGFATGKKRPADIFERHAEEISAAEQLFHIIKNEIFNRALAKDFDTINGEMVITGYFLENKSFGKYEYQKYIPTKESTPVPVKARSLCAREIVLLNHLRHLFYSYECDIVLCSVNSSTVYKYIYVIK